MNAHPLMTMHMQIIDTYRGRLLQIQSTGNLGLLSEVDNPI
jgi:hypothetical protein